MKILSARTLQFLFIFLTLIFSPIAIASGELVARCDGCSFGVKAEGAREWAWANGTYAEKSGPPLSFFSKVVNVIDLKNETVDTFIVTHQKNPRGQWSLPFTYIEHTTTSASFTAKFNNVKASQKTVRDALNGAIIPESVVENAWTFVNCLYCENVVQDYLRATTDGKIESAWLAVQSLALSVGLLSEPLPSTHTINLEGGGYIVIEISISAEMELFIAIIKVVDADSNTVPESAEDLNNRNVYISSPSASESINHYINSFEYYVPIGPVGTVTIQECGKNQYQPDDCSFQ